MRTLTERMLSRSVSLYLIISFQSILGEARFPPGRIKKTCPEECSILSRKENGSLPKISIASEYQFGFISIPVRFLILISYVACCKQNSLKQLRVLRNARIGVSTRRL